MKILFMADVHLRSQSDRPRWRTDDHYKTQFNELYEISEIAKDKDVDIIISLGDFFDHTRVSHQLVTDVLKWAQSLPCYTMSIVGNHDVTGYITTDRNNGLGILFESGAIHQLTETVFDNEKVIIKGVNVFVDPRQGDYMFDEKYDNYYKIIASHNFIIPHVVPFDAVLPEHVKTNANVVMLGHYHQAFHHTTNDTVFVNPGSISRWAVNEQHHPKVVILDTKTDTFELVRLKSSLPASEIFDLNEVADMHNKELNLQAFIDSLNNTKFENVDVEQVVIAEGAKQNVSKNVLDLVLNKVQQAKLELK